MAPVVHARASVQITPDLRRIKAPRHSDVVVQIGSARVICGRDDRISGQSPDAVRGQLRQYVGMVPTPDWLDRYRAGQRDQVWHELRQLGGAVREPGLREQAQAVCDEMARRPAATSR